jgi:hypothetical protein
VAKLHAGQQCQVVAARLQELAMGVLVADSGAVHQLADRPTMDIHRHGSSFFSDDSWEPIASRPGEKKQKNRWRRGAIARHIRLDY